MCDEMQWCARSLLISIFIIKSEISTAYLAPDYTNKIIMSRVTLGLLSSALDRDIYKSWNICTAVLLKCLKNEESK